MSECACRKCVTACRNKPGWFNPGQAEAVAEYLGISLEELFRTKLSVDYWIGDGDVFVLTPANENAPPGKEYPFNPGGKCVFLDENGRCSIHPVKPFECSEFMHDEPRGSSEPRKEKIVNNWKKHQGQITELLGRSPQTPEPNIGDFLSLFRK